MRIELGHWEIDTVMGCGSKHCIVTLVERATGYTLIGQLNDRTTESLNRRVIELMKSSGKEFKTITADNGTEFHQYEIIEQATGVTFYFATPHHSWERGTNENSNGLIRQYLPKKSSMSWQKLRHAVKQRRKRYRSKDSRGRLRNKRHISERPSAVDARIEIGHWEIDTVMGCGSKHCIVTLVERATGYTLIGQLNDRTTESLNRRVIELIQHSGKEFKTITADNGTEFHQYEVIEQATGVAFYFATPHHSWERGTNENTNGLIRQYLPKKSSMSWLKQADCYAIAKRLNTRPRKRLGFITPERSYHERTL